MATLHTFHPETGEWTGTRPARENPKRSGQHLVPAFATLMPPPLTSDTQVAVWDAGAGGWRTEIDRRGERWWDEDGAEHRVEAIGEAPPPGAVADPPPGPDHVRSGGEWVPRPAYASADAAKAAVLGWMRSFETSVTGPVTEGERTSWRDQEPAARAVLAGEPDHPGYAFLDAMGAITGEDRVEASERIVRNADTYRRLIGPLVGYRRTIFAAIDAAEDLAEVEAVTADGLLQLQQFAREASKAAAGGAL